MFDTNIMKGLEEHYKEALTIFPQNRILGIMVQGSQNYNLNYEHSDLDTKCIILPTFEEIYLNKEPVSYTHVRENNEHIDFKDIRLMMSCFKKQNINFVEILFTKYFILNPDYADLFKQVMDNKERIVHYNFGAFLKCTNGMSKEKMKALTLDRPSQHDEIVEYGWASKQLHHIIRLNDFIKRYISGVSFEECLIPENREYLLNIKRDGHKLYTIEEAKELANKYCEDTQRMKDEYLDSHDIEIDSEVGLFLNKITMEILKRSLKREILE